MLLTLGLTPAVQRVMVFDRVVPGRVNRAAETVSCAAGKAINAARAARCWSASLSVVAAGVQGGVSGMWCRERLEAERIETRFAGMSHETRTCVTVIDRAARGGHDGTVDGRGSVWGNGEEAGGEVTELVEESQPLDVETLDGVLRKVAESARRGGMLLCAGTLTPDAPASFYREAAEVAYGCELLVDAKGDVLLEALRARGRGRRVAKVNREEALATTGVTSIDAAAAALHAAGATHVVITDGADAVWWSEGGGLGKVVPPAVRVVNTTGCGDCLAGVLAACLLEGRTFDTSVRLATLASTASAEELLPSAFGRERVEALGG